MKPIFRIALGFFLTLMVLATPTINVWIHSRGFYQPHLNLVYCETEAWICRHEVGHILDHDMGQISKSPEFGGAISTYMYLEYKYGDMNSFTEEITRVLYYSDVYHGFGQEMDSSPQQELYASLYADVKGDITKLPTILQPFYSNDPKYQSMYEYLLVNKIIFPVKGETQ